MILNASIIQVQTLINSGAAWTLEGHVGRVCMAALQNGDAMLGTKSHFYYWGTRVPSRDEVKEGTPGSVGFVRDTNGDDYAMELAQVGSDVLGVML